MRQVVSAVPGRLRIKNSLFADADAVQRTLEALTQNLPVTHARSNLEAHSVVIHYSVEAISLTEMQVKTEEIVAATLNSDQAPHTHKKRRRSSRLKLNRYAKIGALTSLAACLAFAYAGPKRLHIITGWVFIACLSAHLAIFRRTLVH